MCKKIVVLALMVVISFVPRICISEQESQKPYVGVKPYQVNPELDNVVNLAQFRSFTPEQKELLAKNGFVVTTSDIKQLYYIYENNDYLQIPSFITTDLVLQVYHIFFDYTLRTIESEKLYQIAVDLTEKMLSESMGIYEEVTNPEVKQAALKNIAFFGVVLKLLTAKEESLQTIKDREEEEYYKAYTWLGGSREREKKKRDLSYGLNLRLPLVSRLSLSLPPDAETLIENELQLIRQHEGRTNSPIFGFMLDYSQFIPRGHYTRTERLKRYFAGMMWYGLVPFPLRSDEKIIQSILFTYILFHTQKTGADLIKQWERLYHPTIFYVGSTDDLNPFHCKELMDEVYGDDLKFDQIPSGLDKFIKASKRLPEPQIKQVAIGIPTGKQFRFMGQRYIPDSEMLQRLSDYDHRSFPKGLGVMAVLGSKRAYDILINVYKEDNRWPNYPVKMDSLKDKFSELDLSTWQSNLYYGWLWSLQALLEEKKEGHPIFMTNPAWQDKVLNTTCASWAELRHDTILYGKQSVAEHGGETEEPPSPPKGYVEPEVEFYSRLEWLTRFTKEGLMAREIITPALEQKFEYLEDLISFLKRVSLKELKGEPLTREEYDQIKILGAEIERLTLSVAEGVGELLNETDKDMAVIADVHTSLHECLEEGVGHANEIYVVVPIEGELYLTRGAVFSYYEFIHPVSDRLTDEKWQEMLKSDTPPKPPVWTNSFTGDKKERLPRPR